MSKACQKYEPVRMFHHTIFKLKKEQRDRLILIFDSMNNEKYLRDQGVNPSSEEMTPCDLQLFIYQDEKKYIAYDNTCGDMLEKECDSLNDAYAYLLGLYQD